MFYPVLARLAAQLLLGLAVFLWGMIAFFDTERATVSPFFAIGCGLALAGLIGLSRGLRWSAWAGAIGLIAPIGILADGNGASRWLWLFWLAGIWATERWIRDGVMASINRPVGKHDE